MAKRKKSKAARKAKAKLGKARSKPHKKVAKRVALKRAKKTSEPSLPGVGKAKRVRARQQKQPPQPAVVDTIIDVIDEPAPGVLRVTEIEEVSVAVPDGEKDDEEE